jgi:hypothetical protein
LRSDPGENDNLIDTHKEEANELTDWLERWISDGLAHTGRREDPLCAQDLTLGKRWDQWLGRANQ